MSNGKHFEYDPVRHNLSCEKNVIQFFNYKVAGCSQTGVLAGFVNTVNGNASDVYSELLKLAEYCYDEVEMRTIFAHHTIAARSPFIESQVQYNVESGSHQKTCETTQPGSVIELFSSGNLDELLR